MSLLLSVRNICYPCYFEGLRDSYYLNVLMTPEMSNEEIVSQIVSEGSLYARCLLFSYVYVRPRKINA